MRLLASMGVELVVEWYLSCTGLTEACLNTHTHTHTSQHATPHFHVWKQNLGTTMPGSQLEGLEDGGEKAAPGFLSTRHTDGCSILG